MKSIELPLSSRKVKSLKAGDEVLLSGFVYTARDQAHKRLISLIKQGKKLPFDLRNQVIYYCGPTAAAPGKVIGSCGPTTSSRMDRFTEDLLKRGLKGTIGKGRRCAEIRDLFAKYGAVYLSAPPGCGAFLQEKVTLKKTVCFKDLGPEAVYKLRVKEFPCLVVIDSRGRDFYARL